MYNDKPLHPKRMVGTTTQLVEYMRPAEAATYTGVSESTLAKLRMRSKRKFGPKFAKMNGCVIYRRTDLDEWIANNTIEVET